MTESRKRPALRLAKLPDRKPVKMTITLSAELAAKLRAYADTYREVYGETEDVAELVPFMLATFIDSDRSQAARKNRRKSALVPNSAPLSVAGSR